VEARPVRLALVMAIAGALAAASTAQARAPLSASTSVQPSPAFFGERISARVELVVNDDAVDPDSVRFTPDFTPYAIIGRPQRSRSSAGGVTTLGYVFRLQCLNDDCLPHATSRTVRLPVAHARAGENEVTVRWPALVVAPRVSRAQVAADRPPWRVQLAVPSVSYGVRPGAASAIAWSAAVVLALAGGALIGWEALRRRRLRLERERRLSRLQQAVVLARESAGRSGDDRRKALALLARELNGDRELARAATQLAWNRAEPSPERMTTLLDEIDREVARR
jgi:hypothetical protein